MVDIVGEGHIEGLTISEVSLDSTNISRGKINESSLSLNLATGPVYKDGKITSMLITAT